MSSLTVHVYMDDGRVYSYDVDGHDKAREHAAAIVCGGYRHTPEDGSVFEHYGPHRVLKVKVTGGPVPSKYADRSSGT